MHTGFVGRIRFSFSLPNSTGESSIFHIYLGCTKSYLTCHLGWQQQCHAGGCFRKLASNCFRGLSWYRTAIYSPLPQRSQVNNTGTNPVYRCYISPHTHTQPTASIFLQPLARDNASLHPLPNPECFTLLRLSDGLSQVWQRQIARRTGSYQA